MASNSAFAVDAPPGINVNFDSMFNDGGTDPETGTGDNLPPSVEFGNVFANTGTGAEITGSGAIQITQASAYPPAFNPSNGEKTTITYQLSAEGVVELDILDGAEKVVVNLVDDESVLAGQPVSVDWTGTDSATGSGTVVTAGNYKYQIIAKDPTSLQMQSMATGYVQVDSVTDFEEPGDVTDTGYADVTLHNAPPSNTSGTGPEMLVFLLFPIGGYLINKKFFVK